METTEGKAVRKRRALGGLRQRGAVWYVSLHVGGGRYIEKSTKVSSPPGTARPPKAAEAALQALFQKYGRGNVKPDARLTVAGFLTERWLPVLTVRAPMARKAKGSISQSTFESYRETVTAHLAPFFDGLRLDGFTSEDVARYIAAKRKAGLSDSTVHRHLMVLRAALDAAIAFRLMPGPNPVDALPKNIRPQAKKVSQDEAERMRLTDEEQERFLRVAVATKHPAFYVTLALTGLRTGEALGLKWGDVDLDAKSLHVRRSIRHGIVSAPKTLNSEREVALLAHNVKILRTWKAHQGEQRMEAGPDWPGDDWVFTNGEGHDLDLGSLRRNEWRRVLKAADLRPGFRFHDLRHSHGSWLVRHGWSANAVQRRLGHSDPATTMRLYIHTGQEEQSIAVAALDRSVREG